MADELTFQVQIAGRNPGGDHTRRPWRDREPAPRYLSPRSAAPRDDRRYKTQRWRQGRLRVLNRDLWICRVVAGCPVRATVADHVLPVYPGMPDALFFGMGNLRAACHGHNKARGFAPDVPTPAPTAVVVKDYT